MPRQNRVTPSGELVAVPERGALMGNRGCLHDDGGTIVRRYSGRRWIYCRLEYRGQHRQVMTPRRYTELFFLDEVTALAAGHRPCKRCLPDRYAAYLERWPHDPSRGRPGADEVDAALHAERLGPLHATLEWPELAGLPDGAMVASVAGGEPCLRWEGGLWRWSFGGYEAWSGPTTGGWRLLTPPSTSAVLAAGFAPAVHSRVLLP